MVCFSMSGAQVVVAVTMTDSKAILSMWTYCGERRLGAAFFLLELMMCGG